MLKPQEVLICVMLVIGSGGAGLSPPTKSCSSFFTVTNATFP